mgnify:CR=1 FL=1
MIFLVSETVLSSSLHIVSLRNYRNVSLTFCFIQKVLSSVKINNLICITFFAVLYVLRLARIIFYVNEIFYKLTCKSRDSYESRVCSSLSDITSYLLSNSSPFRIICCIVDFAFFFGIGVIIQIIFFRNAAFHYTIGFQIKL